MVSRCLKVVAFIPVALLFFFVLSADIGAAAQTEREIEALKRQIEEIQRQNEMQIEALQRRIRELEEKQAKPAEAPKPKEGWWDKVEAGYKDGAFIKTKDDKWSFKFGTRLQFRFFVEDFDKDRDLDNEYSFQMRRLRLYFSGNAFMPWIKYYVQLNADRGSDFVLSDYYVDFARFKESALQLGQYKVPYNLEELTSSSALEFVDRSIVNDEFVLGRDIGVMLHGEIGKMFEYGASISNGTGRNKANNEDNDFMYVARVAFSPFGTFKYSQAHLEKHPEKPLLRIAAAIAGIPGLEPAKEKTDGKAGKRCEDIGAAKCDVVQFTADGVFKWMGFSSEVEYQLRNIDPSGDFDSTLAWGLRAQVGYVYWPYKTGIAFRFAVVDPDTDVGNDKRYEYTPALSYYPFGHRLKLQADYSYLVEEEPDGGDLNDNRFRVQLQFYF